MKNINKDKDFLMFSGVAFFMVLIGFLWFLSVQDNFKIIKSQNKDNAQIKSDMKHIENQLNNSMDEMNSQFKEIGELLNSSNSDKDSKAEEISDDNKSDE